MKNYHHSMGIFTYAVFFSYRFAVGSTSKNLIERMVIGMQEPFKEMYLDLYKHLETLHKTLDTLASQTDEALGKTSDMYLAYLQQYAMSDEFFDKQFADLHRP